jgi:hypothetical protein
VIKTFAICLEFDFLGSQLVSILQSLPLTHLALFLSLDTIVYDGIAELLACTTDAAGTVGFHTVVDRFATKANVGLQVFGYSAWLTPPAAFPFSDFEDIAFLAHEVVEAVNDPFIGTANVPGGPLPISSRSIMHSVDVSTLSRLAISSRDWPTRPSQLRSTISHITPRMSS